MTRIAIIPSAWEPQNPLFSWIYDPMIPINGKPAIDYILEQNKKWWATKFIVILNKLDTNTYLYLQFRKNKNLIIVVQDNNTSTLGHSIYLANPYVQDGDDIIVNLWDTIFVSATIDKDIVLTSNKKISDPSKRCFVDKNMMFFNNPEVKPDNWSIVSWVYTFSNPAYFFTCLANVNHDFYKSIEMYHKGISLSQVPTNDDWYDLWHIDEYYKSKVAFLRTRSFNNLEYDNFRWILTKRSKNHEKLKREINWYLNMPNDLRIFMPRLVDYYTWDKCFYSLEFYGYPTLADSFIFWNYPLSYRHGVIDRLFEYINYVRSHHQINFPFKNIYNMYYEKTHDRITKNKDNSELSCLLSADHITINWTTYDNNCDTLLTNLSTFIETKIHKESDYSIIHWDLCFSNILYDTHNGIIKLIDPRWYFGEVSIYGDIKYDIAKIRHSIHGKYEYIVADLFSLEYDLEKMNFNYSYFRKDSYTELIKYFDSKCEDLWFDINTIKYIEWLLFLTMIPLHSDNKERQIMMYLTAVQIFNSIL